MQLGHGWPRMAPSSYPRAGEGMAGIHGWFCPLRAPCSPRPISSCPIFRRRPTRHTYRVHAPALRDTGGAALAPWPPSQYPSLSLSVCPASLPPKLLEAFASDRDRPRPTGDNQSMQMRSDPPERGTDHCFLFGIGIGIGREDRSRIGEQGT